MMEQEELERVLEAVLFAAGEPVGADRLAAAAGCPEEDVHAAAKRLMDRLAFDRRGIRLLKLEDAYQLCSAPEMIAYITAALETRKPPKLSGSQLETLTIVAYYQPATRALVEQLRGVDSSYTMSALVSKKLIEECGRLNVPGRPLQYRTTKDFLRTFSLQSLEDLPQIEKLRLDGEALRQEAEQAVAEQAAPQLTMEGIT